MWAVGVIMLSIVTRQYPVFYSPDDLTAMAEQICIFGNSYLDVAKKIYDRKIEMNFETSEYCLTDLCRKLFKKNSSENERFWSEKTLDLLEKLLELDFSKRITAEEALNHDFFK
ncbi:Cell division control protein 7 [Bonamia ostreae]|uniref:non-specific serine/threonine protein kinase n=1 Tax=Bonamia ostreae TaxID=126728 RepID=A0ABV2AFW5_9EUKA